jgi:Copper type II ascorbate-dependent monooxygenase, C-terminal domain
MRRILSSFGLALTVAAAAACGGGGGNNGGPDAAGSGNPDAAMGSPDADMAGWTKLISRSWSLTAGQTDTYKCVRITVPEDMYITAFKAVAPQGTHHTVLTMAASGTDGDYDCNAGNLDLNMLFASGVGTDEMAFPDGVGIKVPAGQHVNLNLHLFDATDHALDGTTEIWVKTVPSVTQEAEMVFSGTFSIDIPSDNVPHTADGGCTLSADQYLVALWPHEHQTGIHQKVTLTPSGGAEQVLLDKDYSFSEQKNYPWTTPVAAHAGDTLWTTCTYQNDTGMTEMFGDSSLDEMCFTGIYRYPKQAGSYLFECATGKP